MNNRLIPCHNCNHSHDSHYNVDDENKFCKYCTCKRCQCIGCRTDIVSRRNPVSSWHKGRIRVATVTYKREKKDKNFYRGYLAAHKKFIEIGQKGSEPDYEKYVKLFTQKYYGAEGENVNYWAGCRYAAIESRTGMKHGVK